MERCKWCGMPFLAVKVWQLFCSHRCQQDWHLDQRKLARQEELYDKLRRRDEALARLSKGQLAQLVQDSRGTPEQRRQASKVLAELDEHRAKWVAIRAEWAEEDREERRARGWRRM
jgi:hypothetical protein